MKTSYARFSLIILISSLLSACSPHPATGVWKAVAENKLGISKLTVGFEGRAEFVSSKQGNTVWHCFWGISDKIELSLDCTPSTNPEKNESFVLRINDQGLAELRQDSTLLATFSRLDENPSPKK